MKRLAEFKKDRPVMITVAGLIWDLLYGLFNLILFCSIRSYWYLTMAAFFISLGVLRLLAISRKEYLNKVGSVIMLFLAVVVAGINYLTIDEVINPQKDMALIIAQAAFTFGIFVMAVINMVSALRKKETGTLLMRCASFASAIGSMLSLERAMLGTFGDPGSSFVRNMEAGTGFGAFCLLILMAIILWRNHNPENN